MSAPAPPAITLDDVCTRWECVLLDAFGVLVDGAGALPGAAALVARLEAAKTRWFVVTNDASRLPETVAGRLAGFGMEVPVDHVITSGQLIEDYVAEHELEGARFMVLGTDDSKGYVTRAGGTIVPVAADAEPDVVVVADDEGYPFLGGTEAAMSALFRRIDRGDEVHLVLPNPDLIYPKREGEYGFTSGIVALMLEAALARRYRDRAPRFARLGKPHAPMFERARRLAGTDSLVMVGDQLETDIAGAVAAGIDAVLLESGVSAWRDDAEVRPDYRLPSLTGSPATD